MNDRFIETHIAIQDLVLMYEQYGKCHEIDSGRIGAEYQKKEKPPGATRGNSYPNL